MARPLLNLGHENNTNRGNDNGSLGFRSVDAHVLVCWDMSADLNELTVDWPKEKTLPGQFEEFGLGDLGASLSGEHLKVVAVAIRIEIIQARGRNDIRRVTFSFSPRLA